MIALVKFQVVVANIHSAEIFLDGYGRYYMKPDEAVIRHYQNIHIDNWAKKLLPQWKELGGGFPLTDYPAEHITTLRENVQHRLHSVYGEIP
ncbi:hypothetical protein KIN20_009757 [Parelaphostrongylus tenuis]|uniref:Uncharacterized protein n=1 Tax=Parelaphostrongylus tenuis TaxID=148309 RepID=A0AAD5MQZ8_PARTN|nr:hypothetical protein KIN20_009757 [Parelaphostrongylus tenuis]